MKSVVLLYFLVFAVFLGSGCRSQIAEADLARGAKDGSSNSLYPAGPAFTLQTGLVDGRMVFIGVGEAIDGLVNPDLVVRPGDTVRLTLINKDGMSHDLSIPDLKVQTPLLSRKDALATVGFTLTENQSGTYNYLCTVPGHKQAGMTGNVIVAGSPSSGK
jgi:nitrite reductase (NO-forming)